MQGLDGFVAVLATFHEQAEVEVGLRVVGLGVDGLTVVGGGAVVEFQFFGVEAFVDELGGVGGLLLGACHGRGQGEEQQ